MNSGSPWTIAGLAETVADPNQYAGGGAVAAMSLAGAAATAELVLRLTARRKGLPETTAKYLSELAASTRSMKDQFTADIDLDIASLSELMDAMRADRRARKSGAPEERNTAQNRLDTALRSAIESPLTTARTGIELLRAIRACQQEARTFTMSDLGAAAATANGGIVSLLFMADVNIDMLDDTEAIRQARDEIDVLRATAHDISQAVIATTDAAIRPRENQEQR